MKVGLISAVFALLCASLAIASTEAGVQPVLGKIYDDNGDAVIPAAKPWQQSIMNDLGKQLSPQGAVILPSDAERWDDVTVRWNMFKWPRVGHVVAAVEAGTTDDVKKAVKYAIDNGIQFMIRNSGHGWTQSFHQKWKGEGLVISIRKLDEVVVDTEKNEMTVKSGVKNWQVVEALYKAKRRTAMALCDCISYLGLSLGGGHGRFQGYHGLVADNLLSATVLLSSGDIVTASSTSHPDLFWALRGPGHNFGLVLEATFKVHEPLDGDDWLNAEYIYDTTPGKITAVFDHLNKLRGYQPAGMTIWTYMMPMDPATPEKLHVRVSVQHGGKDLAAFKPFGEEFLALNPITSTEEVLPLTKVADHLAMGKNVPGFCTTPGPKRGIYSVLLKEFNTTNVVDMYTLLGKTRKENPSLGTSIMVFESYPQQEFKKVATETTAYPHRDQNIITMFLLQSDRTDDEDDKVIETIGEEARDLITRGVDGTRRAYVNYAMGNEGLEAMYYGNEPWRRLMLDTVKEKWDPKGSFSKYNPVSA